MIERRINPKSKQEEYCMVSRDGKRVLEYYGIEKPTAEQIAKTEKRVNKYSTPSKK